jgi:N-methylhydantoinase B
MKRVDSITTQIVNTNLSGIVQEMQQSLFRTGYSTIIRESQDASCAILDRDGKVVSQHVVLPLHTGTFPAAIKGILDCYSVDQIERGDAFIVNHPYLGGTPHASDMAVITPIFFAEELVGFCANMAHKSDIGGTVPGSGSGSAREIYHEGLHVPPLRYVHGYEPIKEVEYIIRSNSRTPDLVIGDINGQIGSNRLGERRVEELMDKMGKETILAVYQELFDYTEKRVREAIKKWPDGIYHGESWIDNDGIELEKHIRISVSIEKRGDQILFDFSDSDDQTLGPANIRPPLVQAACYYCLTAWIDKDLPINNGLARMIETKFRSGSVLDPELPAPVNSYIATAQAVVEAIVSALGQNIPGTKMAGSCGSGALVFGGKSEDSNKQYVQYEILGGGMGARNGKDGVSGTTVHVSNGRTASIEILESEFPVMVTRFELAKDSGGAGEFRGGLGFIREYQILNDDVRASMRSDKHVIVPNGVLGGLDSLPGQCVVNPVNESSVKMPSRFGDLRLKSNDIVKVVRPGGGGLGNPHHRPAQKVLEDFLDGYISFESVLKQYGIVIRNESGQWVVDHEQTERIRSNITIDVVQS